MLSSHSTEVQCTAYSSSDSTIKSVGAYSEHFGYYQTWITMEELEAKLQHIVQRTMFTREGGHPYREA